MKPITADQLLAQMKAMTQAAQAGAVGEVVVAAL